MKSTKKNTSIMSGNPESMQHLYLSGVLFQDADGLGVDGGGLGLQVCDGAVGLDGQDGVGLGHVYCVLDVSRAAVLQLHLLQAALVVSI